MYTCVQHATCCLCLRSLGSGERLSPAELAARAAASADPPEPGARPPAVNAACGIELRHLRYFLAVFEELHFGRAAARVQMAQPPLSQAIRKLEDELGVQLLHRTSRVVTPTEAGRIFAEDARRVLATFELAVAEARRAGGAKSCLRIGCVPDVPIERLQLFLNALQERGVASQTQVMQMLTHEQIGRLRAGELDLGIFHHAEEHDGIETQPLFEGERLAAFLPKNHRLGVRPVLGRNDLEEDDLALVSRINDPALHNLLLEMIEGAGYRFRSVREAGCSTARDVMLAVASGLGVAFRPFSFKDASDAGCMVIRRELDPPLWMPETRIGWIASPSRNLAASIPAIRAAARELYLATTEPLESERATHTS
jgi:DNA-binding transcriptional LysR family regulator